MYAPQCNVALSDVHGSVILYRYNPPSVKPSQIIAGILRVVFPDARTFLDVTPGRGNFWPKHHKLDLTLSQQDFRELSYDASSFDVVVFDPPHNADMGHNSAMKAYGTYKFHELPGIVGQGSCEAMRVARLGVIIKVTDQVHAQRFQYEAGWVIDELGVPYEIIHGQHHHVSDPKWKQPPCSAYSNGSTYLVYRHGNQNHVRRSNGNN